MHPSQLASNEMGKATLREGRTGFRGKTSFGFVNLEIFRYSNVRHS